MRFLMAISFILLANSCQRNNNDRAGSQLARGVVFAITTTMVDGKPMKPALPVGLSNGVIVIPTRKGDMKFLLHLPK